LPDNKELEYLDEVLCTPVISAESYFDETQETRDWYGLALVPVSAESISGGEMANNARCFKRVGKFNMWASNHFEGYGKVPCYIV
jgi:hypothetical protein